MEPTFVRDLFLPVPCHLSTIVAKRTNRFDQLRPTPPPDIGLVPITKKIFDSIFLVLRQYVRWLCKTRYLMLIVPFDVYLFLLFLVCRGAKYRKRVTAEHRSNGVLRLPGVDVMPMHHPWGTSRPWVEIG